MVAAACHTEFISSVRMTGFECNTERVAMIAMFSISY